MHYRKKKKLSFAPSSQSNKTKLLFFRNAEISTHAIQIILPLQPIHETMKLKIIKISQLRKFNTQIIICFLNSFLYSRSSTFFATSFCFRILPLLMA